jgi:hypothetical protein
MNILNQLNQEKMPSDKYITGSCNIYKGIVKKDLTTLFNGNTGNISELLLSVYQYFELQYPKFYKMDNLSKLGWLTAEILLKDNFKKEIYGPEQIGLILANANSSLDNDLKYIETVSEMASPSLFVYTLPNIVIGEICIRNRFKGEHAFFVQESFDADFMAQQVNYLLDKNILEDYKAVLFLVEKKKKENAVLFSAENMRSIFDNING